MEEPSLAEDLASLRIERVPLKSVPATRSAARRPSRWRMRVWPALLAVAVVLAALSLGQRLQVTDVELGSVTRQAAGAGDVVLVATGYVHALRSASLSAPVNARLVSLAVEEGAHVAAGQLLAELDPADAQAANARLRAEESEAAAKVAAAQLAVADAERKRSRQAALARGQATSLAEHADAEAALAAARQQLVVAQAERRVVSARRRAGAVDLEHTRLRAPFAGTVLRRLAEVGETVGPLSNGSGSGSAVLTLASLDALEVQADVAEAQMQRLRVGMAAEIGLDAFDGRRFAGRVTAIRRTLDRSKAAVTVRIAFVDKSADVLPDMAAKVSFLARPLDVAPAHAAPRLVVPADAVVNRDGHAIVWLASDGVARAAAVTTSGAAGAGLVALADGAPAAGSRVVRHPPAGLHDGSRVHERAR